MNEFTCRSMLFVPAGDARKRARAAVAGADALILDWEDGTAPEDKPEARRATLAHLAGARGAQPVWVRVNAAGSPEFAADLEALAAAAPPDGIVLPKCESAAELCHAIARLETTSAGRACPFMPMIESAGGLLAAPGIARCSTRVAALGFGAEDFSADAGLQPGADGRELLYARSAVVVAARAAGVEAVDSPSVDLADPVEDAARAARRLGFSGKMAVHPAQLAAIHAAFTPSPEEVAGARALVEAFEVQSSGAIRFQGKMVDRPVVLRARRLLARTRPGPRPV